MRILRWYHIRFFFAWYDFWVGVFVDTEKRTVYICPLPCCVIQISYLKPRDIDMEWGLQALRNIDPGELE